METLLKVPRKKISKSGLQHTNKRKLRIYYIYTFFKNGPRWVLGLHGNITDPTKKQISESGHQHERHLT